jgi:hypothetical protein
VTYKAPPILDFRVTEVIAGSPVRNIVIHWDFSDWDTQQPEHWKFKVSMLPKVGSKWILFRLMPFCADFPFYRDIMSTFNGSRGRMQYSSETADRVREGVSIHRAFNACSLFDYEHSPVEVAYTVSKEGHIENVHLTKGSVNDRFNQLGSEQINDILNSVKSDLGWSFFYVHESSADPTVEHTITISKGP